MDDHVWLAFSRWLRVVDLSKDTIVPLFVNESFAGVGATLGWPCPPLVSAELA